MDATERGWQVARVEGRVMVLEWREGGKRRKMKKAPRGWEGRKKNAKGYDREGRGVMVGDREGGRGWGEQL